MSGQVSYQQLASVSSGRPPVCIDGDGRGDGCRDVGEHVLQATHRLGQHLAGDLHQGFRNVVSDIGTSTRDVVSDVRETGAENLVATRDIGMAFLKGFCDLGLALQGDTCAIDLTVAQTGDAIQNDLKDFVLSNVEHQRDILSGVLIQGGKDRKATLVTASETQIKVVSEEGKSRATTREESYKLQLGQKQLLLEGRDTREKARDKIGRADRRAAKETAAILLDACRNKGELSLQIDRCCCDLKLLVTEEDEATRTLLLEQAIAALELQVAILSSQMAPCIPNGTWQPIVTPDPSLAAHTVLSVSMGTFVRNCPGNEVMISFLYTIDAPSTGGSPVQFGDFATLPFPPVPAFTSVTDASGTPIPTPATVGNSGFPGIVLAEVGGFRIRMVYVLIINTPDDLVQVQVTATYTI
jgi:hypothetical protein